MFCSRCGTWTPNATSVCTLCGQPLHPGEPARHPEAPATAVGVAVSYAGFWQRAGAVVLDSFVLFFPVAISRVLMGLSAWPELLPDSPHPPAAMAAEVMIDWLYAAGFLASHARATLGMQVMGIQLTGLHGQRVSFMRATWRFFAQVLDLVTFGVGYLLMLVTPRRQTLHDLVSGTVMVRTSEPPAAHAAAAVRLAP